MRCSSRNTMFAQRFDPDAEIVEKSVPKSLSRKRKLSNASSLNLEAEKSDSSSETEDDSDSSSDSSSDSDSSDNSDSSDSSDNEEQAISNKTIDSQISKSPDDMDIEETEGSPAIKRTEDSMHIDTSAGELQNEETKLIEDDYTNRHSKIFDKFKNIRALDTVDLNDEQNDQAEAQELAPMPQPALPRDEKLVSTLTYLKNLEWLAKPAYSKPDKQRPFAEFPLSDNILANLKGLGFEGAFSVQISVLELMLKDIEQNKLQPDFKGDILVNSSTGSGKTLAYSIPIVQALQDRIVPRVRAIVLVPTKPLVNQVAATLRDISKGTPLSVVSLSNDLSMREEAVKITANIPDVIVTAPGRLVDHLLRGSISLEALRFLVIDEADRLLGQSFYNWCHVVISNIEKWFSPLKNLANTWKLMPQKMIFSATLTTDAGKLAMLKLTKPRLIIVNTTEQPLQEMFSVPSTLKEHLMTFTNAQTAMKPLYLALFLLNSRRLDSILVFVKSNDATLRLTRILNDLFVKLLPKQQINVAYINSSNNLPSMRSRIFRDFEEKSINILIATDLIARGIDVPSISCVFNYDLPSTSREYVHRVGRTARANNAGEAFTMCFGGGENKHFTSLMSFIGRVNDIEQVEVPELEERDNQIYTEVMKDFQQAL